MHSRRHAIPNWPLAGDTYLGMGVSTARANQCAAWKCWDIRWPSLLAQVSSGIGVVVPEVIYRRGSFLWAIGWSIRYSNSWCHLLDWRRRLGCDVVWPRSKLGRGIPESFPLTVVHERVVYLSSQWRNPNKRYHTVLWSWKVRNDLLVSMLRDSQIYLLTVSRWLCHQTD